MLAQIKGIKLKGANFVNQTELNLFKSSNDKVAKLALVYGRNGSGKSTISNAFKKVKGEDILNGGSHKEEEMRSGRLDFFTVISDDEKVRTAKDILCFMYLLNDMHEIAYLGNIREELNKWCDEIKNEYFL